MHHYKPLANFKLQSKRCPQFCLEQRNIWWFVTFFFLFHTVTMTHKGLLIITGEQQTSFFVLWPYNQYVEKLSNNWSVIVVVFFFIIIILFHCFAHGSFVQRRWNSVHVKYQFLLRWTNSTWAALGHQSQNSIQA